MLFPQHRVLAAGDMYTNGEDLPELIDYTAAAARRSGPRPSTSAQARFRYRRAGPRGVSKKADLVKYRARHERLWDVATQMVKAGKSKADFEKAMRMEFGWADLHVMWSLDGLMKEAR